MAKKVKRILVELSFIDDTSEQPYIKDWWLKQQVSKAISNQLPEMNSKIDDVEVGSPRVRILPEEISVNIKDILSLG